MSSAVLVILVYSLGAVVMSFVYFRCFSVKRPPIGVINLRDVAVMVAGIILIPFFYWLLPTWIVAGLLLLVGMSLIYFLIEGMLPSRYVCWIAAIILTAADLWAYWNFGGNSPEFFMVNNFVQVLLVIGIANLWAQSGMKARDAAILGLVLIAYDFLFTSVLSLMGEFFVRLHDSPFSPMVAWSTGVGEKWLAIGLGDLLLAALFPLVMRKAFGRVAGLTAILSSLFALGAVAILPILGLLEETFPVMVVLGPLMAIQYFYWRHQKGGERTFREYLQAENIHSV
jgi:hypothetical protein